MLFCDNKHKDFYIEKCRSIRNDVYSCSLIYLMGISEETRNNFDKMFDAEKLLFIPDLNAGWQTDVTLKITRLAMNLWNGNVYDSKEDYNNGNVSKEFAPDEIFACSYAPYFFQAIRLRYPVYCQSKGIESNMITNREAKENLDKLRLDERGIVFSRVSLKYVGFEVKYLISGIPEKSEIELTDKYQEFKNMLDGFEGSFEINIEGYSVGEGSMSDNVSKEELKVIEKYFGELERGYKISNILEQTFVEELEGLEME